MYDTLYYTYTAVYIILVRIDAASVSQSSRLRAAAMAPIEYIAWARPGLQTGPESRQIWRSTKSNKVHSAWWQMWQI